MPCVDESNSLSLEDSGSISELDMPKGRPSRRTWVEGDSRRERPVTAGAIVIPIRFDTVVSLPLQDVRGNAHEHVTNLIS
jgi:hypothetical protein